MRQMRLKKREIRDAEKLRQILADCDVVHIGAMDGDGMFVVPVNYGYEFCSESEGEKNVSTVEGFPGSLRLYLHSAGRDGRQRLLPGGQRWLLRWTAAMRSSAGITPAVILMLTAALWAPERSAKSRIRQRRSTGCVF